MKNVSDIEIYKVRKVFDHICENILEIPKDAISIRPDGDTYGIYCNNKYFEKFTNFMMSLDGWKPIKPQIESEGE